MFSWSCPLFQINPPVIVWRSLSLIVALFPILDPIAIILILPEYRRAAWTAMICGKQNIKNNPSTTEMFSKTARSS
ncbi:unnamed protein product [Caenorhabditis angaria]|uniref:Uncharacterized protein n=1 Tax=Caenorhabditis angaria TaxID=860376 RepID=A0A9P1N9L6_9PELO|nr:unnamed protein product [Caenorhabditis angaria]